MNGRVGSSRYKVTLAIRITLCANNVDNDADDHLLMICAAIEINHKNWKCLSNFSLDGCTDQGDGI